MSQPQRMFVDPETGESYRVRVGPYERKNGRGVSRQLNDLVVETEDSRWVGSVPIYRTVTLESLSEDDLVQLLDQAMGRG